VKEVDSIEEMCVIRYVEMVSILSTSVMMGTSLMEMAAVMFVRLNWVGTARNRIQHARLYVVMVY
jgi:hypothetical protein